MSQLASQPGGARGRWWEGATLYQVYVRSFQDSDGDGYGDLAGLASRLDYLAWLGVDGVWLSPTMPSPDQDWGYDVSDYEAVHPELGTLGQLDELVTAASARGMRVLLDLVPNHTSSAHPWFVEARQGRDNPYRDYYVWADPAADGGPPNNWLDSMGACAWAFDEASGQYYLHNFLDSQPDLNWWSPAVHEAFAGIVRFWFDRGIAGFRIDVAHGLYKDAELRDNPPVADPSDREGRFGFARTYSMNRPETHGVYRQWRSIADSYQPARLLLGETWVFDPRQLDAYHGQDDELQLCFNFPFAFAPFQARSLAGVVRATCEAFGSAAPVWTASNHDIGRLATRWGSDDPDRVRLGLLLLTMLPGAVVLYYGDEIGLGDVDVPEELQRDPMTWRGRGGRPSRDRGRTPMPWEPASGAGFTPEGVVPWLPIGDAKTCNVADQRDDPGSTLSLTRALLLLRRQHLGGGIAPYEEVLVDDRRWVFRCGPLLVAANLSGEGCSVEPKGGTVVLSSAREGARGPVQGAISLSPFEGVIVVP